MSQKTILVDCRIIHPFSMIVSGSRGSGQTYFMKSLLQSEFIFPFPNNIIWIYGAYQQELFNELKSNKSLNIEFRTDIDETYPNNSLIIIDDLMEKASNSSAVLNFFVNGRHLKISIIFLTQVLFYKSNYMRSLHLNTEYFTLLKTPRDRKQFSYFAQQMYSKNYEWFLEAIVHAQNRNFGHLFLDLNNKTPDLSRVRGNIFDYLDKIIVYAPRKL